MLPERPELVLTSHVPDGELDVLVLEGLNVEPDRRDGLDELVLLQLEQDRRLPGPVEPERYDPHLDFRPDVDPVIL